MEVLLWHYTALLYEHCIVVIIMHCMAVLVGYYIFEQCMIILFEHCTFLIVKHYLVVLVWCTLVNPPVYFWESPERAFLKVMVVITKSLSSIDGCLVFLLHTV